MHLNFLSVVFFFQEQIHFSIIINVEFCKWHTFTDLINIRKLSLKIVSNSESIADCNWKYTAGELFSLIVFILTVLEVFLFVRNEMRVLNKDKYIY